MPGTVLRARAVKVIPTSHCLEMEGDALSDVSEVEVLVLK